MGGTMKEISLLVFMIGIFLCLVGCFCLWYSRRKQKQLLDRIETMLLEAEKGELKERTFDESRMSRLEMSMYDFLHRSILSGKKLTEEERRIRQLISDISHQTKTPISNILLYSQLLTEEKLPEKAEKMAWELSFQGNQLKWLIESLMKLSRLEQEMIQVNPEPKKLFSLIRQVVSSYSDQAKEKKIRMEYHCGEEEQAFFDPKWTREALSNLLDNSIKYTPIGGSVQILVTGYPMFERIDIKDTGIGISEEEQPKVFSRFYRGQQVKHQEGAGIGLALVREIIKKQGGYIKLTSACGIGSCFSVFLPKEEQNIQEERGAVGKH